MLGPPKIGLVGIGIWGEKIHQELTGLGAETRVLENDPALKKKAGELKATWFTTDIDQFKKQTFHGIIIASPSSGHLALIKELSTIGVPMLVEKPLTTNLSDALEVRKLGHKQIFVGHIWKYHPGIILLREIADSGMLGEIKGAKSVRTNWTSPRKDTNSLWNLAIHDLTIAESILGFMPEPKAVTPEVHGKNIRGLIALLGTSPYYHFEVSNRYPDKKREVRVFGSQAVAILWDEKKDFIEIFEGDDQSELKEQARRVEFFDPTPPLRLEIADFLNYLMGGEPPKSGLEEGIRLVQKLDQLEKMCKVL